MKVLYFSSLIFGILIVRCNMQCLTRKDDMSFVKNPDLAPILGFELDLFKNLLPPGPQANFFMSPYSVWNTMVMAYFGSAHRTETQLASTLKLTDKLSTLKLYRSLALHYQLRSSMTEGNTFILANKAYFNESIDVRPCMTGILHSEMEKLNFNRPHDSASVINQFVEEITRGKIQNIIKPQDILNANMALVNAAYFKGSWMQPFDPVSTTTQTFTTFDGHEFPVNMMAQFSRFNTGYDENLGIDVLELPYVGETTSMYIFLPFNNNQFEFDQFLTQLSTSTFEKIISETYPTMVDVRIPKFKMETLVEDNLIQVLKRMGIHDAFSRKNADFTEFSANGYFTLDKALHKAYVDVNEEGTEAAASTVVISTKSGVRTQFHCNRPFLFVIRDTVTKNNLFMGVYKSPPESNPTVVPSTDTNWDQTFNRPITGTAACPSCTQTGNQDPSRLNPQSQSVQSQIPMQRTLTDLKPSSFGFQNPGILNVPLIQNTVQHQMEDIPMNDGMMEGSHTVPYMFIEEIPESSSSSMWPPLSSQPILPMYIRGRPFLVNDDDDDDMM